ncbi:MAG: hypothetical protein HXM81_07520, partial [Neisseria sicca]|nr:hypothetical protein [Neisseria sicca]
GMQAQGDVGRLGHGKIGVNNKRRIVAGLEKGRLKTSEASFAKTSVAGFQTTSTVEADGGSMVSVCLAIGRDCETVSQK